MSENALVVDVRDHIFKMTRGEQLKAIEHVKFSLPANSFTCIVGPVSYTHLTLPTKA